MKSKTTEKKRPTLEWYKWLVIGGLIWGIKSYLGLFLALFGGLVWLYRKGFQSVPPTRKLVMTLAIGAVLTILWWVAVSS